MHPELVNLYNLQLADTHLDASRRQQANLDRAEAQQKALTALEAQARALALEKAHRDAALAQATKDLASTEQLISRTEKRIKAGSIHNDHEMESAEKELETFRVRKGALEDLGLQLMEEGESFDPQARALGKKARTLTQERDAVRKAAAEAEIRLGRELEAVTARRALLAAKLPPSLLKLYERARAHHGGRAVARVVEGACEGCRTTIPLSDIVEVLKGPDLVGCRNCGRYLYTDAD